MSKHRRRHRRQHPQEPPPQGQALTSRKRERRWFRWPRSARGLARLIHRLLGNRRVQVRWLVGLILGLTLFGVGVHFLHAHQVKRQVDAFRSQATRAAAEGRRPDAARYLEHYLAHKADDTDALEEYGLLLAQLAQNNRDRSRTLAILSQVLRRDPNRHDCRRRLVDFALQAGWYRDARPHLEALLQSNPHAANGKLLHQLGSCFEAAGDEARAAELYEQAIASQPDQVDSYLRLARLWRYKLGKPEKAARLMDDLVRNNPEKHEAYRARSAYRRQLNDLAGTAADVTRALELAPQELPVLLAAGEGARAANRLDDARGHLTRAAELYPKDPRPYLLLARVEAQAARTKESLAWLHQGLQMLPDQRDLLLELAAQLLDRGKAGEAAEVIARLRAAKADPALLGYLDGHVAMLQGDWSRAVHELERIRPRVAALPDWSRRVDLLLGHCYRQRGEVDRQLAAYRHAIQDAPPGAAAAREGRAAALAALGKLDEALEEYRRILPKVAVAQVKLVPLLLARNLLLPSAQQQWQEIDDILANAAREDAKSVEVVLLRAEAAALRDRTEQAVELLTQARDDQPNQPLFGLALAGLFEAQGQLDKARSLLQETERRFPDRPDVILAAVLFWGRQAGPDGDAERLRLQKGLERFAAGDQARLLRGLAQAYALRGNLAEAERRCAEAAQLQPQDVQLRLVWIDLALRTGNADAIRRARDDLRTLDGDGGTLDRYAHGCHLLALAQKGDRSGLAEARALLAAVEQRRPGWAPAPLRRAQVCELEQDFKAAAAGYLQTIDLGERDPAVIRRAVQLLCQNQEFAQADRLVGRLLQEPAAWGGDLHGLSRQIYGARLGNRHPSLAEARQTVARGSEDARDHLWLGQVAAAAGEAAEAEKAFRQAARLAAQDPVPWLLLAQHLARTGRKDQIEAVIEEARDRLPVAERALALARCWELAGVPARAEEHYRAALSARPTDRSTLIGAAELYLRSSQWARAEPLLRRLLAAGGQVTPAETAAWARRALAVALASQGGPERMREANRLLEENLKAVPSAPDDLTAKALVLVEHGTRSARREARRLLEDVKKRQPLPAREQFFLARLCDGDGDWPQARRLMEEALEAGADTLFLAEYLRHLLDCGEVAAAQSGLAKLAQLAPDDWPTQELRGLALKAQGKAAEGGALLEAFATRASASDADLHRAAAALERWGQAAAAERLYRRYAEQSKPPGGVLALAQYLGRQGRLDEALDVLDRARSACPPEALALSAGVVLSAGARTDRHCQRVAGWLEEALKKAPEKSPTALTLGIALGSVYSLQGRYPEAEQLFRRALAEDARQVGALNNLAAQLALKDGKAGGEEALALANRALEVVGAHPAVLETRAVVYLALGRHGPALADLEDALALKRSPSALMHLARAHQLAGDRSQAIAAWKKAQEAGLKRDHLHPLEQPLYQELAAWLAKE